jgi:hypothetical protein
LGSREARPDDRLREAIPWLSLRALAKQSSTSLEKDSGLLRRFAPRNDRGR